MRCGVSIALGAGAGERPCVADRLLLARALEQDIARHFAALTGGRYRRVFIPAGGKRELRVSDARRDWSAEQLSRGTREQLYLAFRLAVIQDFGETRGALPLIVDDMIDTAGTIETVVMALKDRGAADIYVTATLATFLVGFAVTGAVLLVISLAIMVFSSEERKREIAYRPARVLVANPRPPL